MFYDIWSSSQTTCLLSHCVFLEKSLPIYSFYGKITLTPSYKCTMGNLKSPEGQACVCFHLLTHALLSVIIEDIPDDLLSAHISEDQPKAKSFSPALTEVFQILIHGLGSRNPGEESLTVIPSITCLRLVSFVSSKISNFPSIWSICVRKTPLLVKSF